MRPRAQRLAQAVAALGIALAPCAGLAQPAGRTDQANPQSLVLRLTASGCASVRTERIEELLQLELATLLDTVGTLPRLDVAFQCFGSTARVTLFDSATGKSITRETSLAERGDPERLLAIAASELFLASWAERLASKADAHVRASGAPIAVADGAAERRAPPPETVPVVAIDLLGVGRERRLSAPVPTLQAGLRVGQASTTPLQAFALIGWETGASERDAGRVDVNATALGIGARYGWRFARAQLGVVGGVSAVYVSIEGAPASPSYYGERHDGVAVDIGAGFEASVRVGSMQLGSAASAGVLAPELSGRVQGSTPVRLDGPWAGVTVFAGLLL